MRSKAETHWWFPLAPHSPLVTTSGLHMAPMALATALDVLEILSGTNTKSSFWILLTKAQTVISFKHQRGAH